MYSTVNVKMNSDEPIATIRITFDEIPPEIVWLITFLQVLCVSGSVYLNFKMIRAIVAFFLARHHSYQGI